MALDDIQKHIQEKADEEIRLIRAQSEMEIAELEKQWKERFKVEQERLEKEIERAAESRLAQAKFKIREKINSELLKSKQEQLEKVFDNARKSLIALSETNRADLLETLLKSVKDEEGELLTSKECSAELERLAKKVGVKAMISSDYVDTIGGFVLRAEKIDQDYRFETLMEQVRETSLIEVYELLFKK